MRHKNRLLLSSAGSGKTTYIINEALKCKEDLLITTYTNNNEQEIRNKIISINGYIPQNITIQTWFSFLLQHGVKPFQGAIYNDKIKGVFFIDNNKNNEYKINNIKREDVNYFINKKSSKIYSDKLADFSILINEKTNGSVISRISKVFPKIYIDEIQDFAGYDLEFVSLLSSSDSNLILVGDPRQTTYYTNYGKKNEAYRKNKNIEIFIKNKCENFDIDKETLKKSHRCNQQICDFSSQLFSKLSMEACDCVDCHPDKEHQGVFLVFSDECNSYLKRYKPMQMIWDNRTKYNEFYPYMTYGSSKGLSFNRVLIYPTTNIKKWLLGCSVTLAKMTKAKLYVAITRARYSVAFLIDKKEYKNIKKQYLNIWNPNI